jgi:hypothetical protein
VRLHHEAEIFDDHRHLMLDNEEDDPVPGVRTVAWWHRPHVARADFYRSRVLPFFSPESRSFIEDPLYGHILDDYHERGEAAWWDWRMYIYRPESGTMQRSWHLDSRGDEPKHEQSFVRGDA